ncbi:MAG: DUF6079 family protein [Acidobacteria bacterium]|nr:DUF6079 family protein [Acidobacteriota bacterium]MCI0718355.1 DUF6079 family protein [Acidobacteriota bacterium]
MKIRDLVDLHPQPTVIRLDQLQGKDAGWISDSYYLTEDGEKHLKSLEHLFSKQKGNGIFLIGHYGSGKSHFLAYLTQQMSQGRLALLQRETVPLSLLNYKAAQSLESILEEILQVPPGSTDRRAAWREVMKRHRGGLLLVIDELSEFLRSKPSPQSFNEDIRFLQFLGEWAEEHPFWVLAALQEQIEHTGDLEYDLYRKIKDRYPLRLLLTPTHVKDLIAHRLLRKKAGYASAVEKLARDLKAIYPESSIDFVDFCKIYPLHPMTLELLEEVRDRFSQARGIVDFTLTQLLGSPARGIEPFLEKPCGHLLTPDVIVDHFADLFEVQPEFQAISQKVFPFFRKRVPQLFENKKQQQLAWQLLKLLVLVHLSPRREYLELEEAAQWLLFKASSIDPQKNREIVKLLLDSLVQKGAYLRRKETRYQLDLKDDSTENLEPLLNRTVDELKQRGEAIFEGLLPCLQRAEFNPFSLSRDRWQTRKQRWHFHDRDIQFYLGGGRPPDTKELGLQIGIPWGPPVGGDHCFLLVPEPLELTPEVLELAALMQLKERPLPARLLKRIEERIESRSSWFASLIRSAYLEAGVYLPGGSKTALPTNTVQAGTAGWLGALGEWILRHTFPLFERFAPSHGPLPKEAYRQFMQQALSGDITAEEVPDYVRLIREAYLVPLGLMQRRGVTYLMAQKLDNNELVRLLNPILQHHPAPSRVYQHLGGPVYGLLPDQIHLLLLTLLVQGEIDIVKGPQSYRDYYETLPNPLQYDQIVPGRALNLNQLRDLQTICEGFRIPVPKQWSVLAQKRAIEQLRKLGSRQKEDISQFLMKLKSQGDTGELAEQIEKLITQWLALEKGEHELQGFEHFLFAIGSPQRFLVEASEMASLPARFEKLISEKQRFSHLLSFPCITQCSNLEISVALEALQAPPPLSQPEALEAWLSRAQALYWRYEEWYTNRHNQWWSEVRQHPVWSFQLPAIVRSRHLGLEGAVEGLNALQSRAKSERCNGLSSLGFQPLCRCRFDGQQAPLAETLRRFEEAQQRLDRDLRVFFQQDKVKAQIREWVDQKFELQEETLSYLEGKEPFPKVENVALLDQHLSGLELVRSVPGKALLDFLGDRLWDKAELLKTLEEWFVRYGPRLRFQREELAARQELAAWCCEQVMRQAIPLPPGLSQAERQLMIERMQPAWVSPESLGKLESLGLAEAEIDRVVQMILDGLIPLPSTCPASGPVAAAAELLNHLPPASAEELAQRIMVLYEQHSRFVRLKPDLWLPYLDQLANAGLSVTPCQLGEQLRAHLGAQWLAIDALGIPLLGTLKAALPDGLSAWKIATLGFAQVSHETSTSSFYQELMDREFKKPLIKINAIDKLLHGRQTTFTELTRLACAELEIAFRRLEEKLDPAQPLLLFGDHGFRLSPNGSVFTHGGPSTLERLTLVCHLIPVHR